MTDKNDKHEFADLSRQEAFWAGVRDTLHERTTPLSEDDLATMHKYTDHLKMFGGGGRETLPEWEIVYTFKARVRAGAVGEALDVARPQLETRHPIEMTDVQCRRIDDFTPIVEAIAEYPPVPVRSRNSPIEVLKRKAGEKCTWCWWEVGCGKDPNLGWVHVDVDEYKARGKFAVHACEAPEISDQILELEEAERA
jgi:hypothetical protein